MDISNLSLTTGAINSLLSGNAPTLTPAILQIIGYKKTKGQNEHFRLNVSDGVHYYSLTMLTEQMNHFINDEEIDLNCIIRADKIILNKISDKKVLIISELTVLAKGDQVVGGKLGDPVPWTEESKKLITMLDYFIPIGDITCYSCIGIKARVIYKSEVRHWSNAKGAGSYFSMHLLDQSGEIKVTAFNKEVQKFYDFIEPNNVYYITKYQVDPADIKFNTCDHRYEIKITNKTEIIQCDSSSGAVVGIPYISYNFIPISRTFNLGLHKIIDILGVCKTVGPIETIIIKDNNNIDKHLQKRELVLVDQSNSEININLWGKVAEDYIDYTKPIISIKSARVSQYGAEKYLNVLQSSILQLNPDISEAHVLREWFDKNHHHHQQQQQQINDEHKWKLIKEIISYNNNILDTEHGIIFMSKVIILEINTTNNCMYMACPASNCYKKVTDFFKGTFHCSKCNKDYFEFKWRYNILVKFGDFSDSIWINCFSKVAELILGIKANIFGPMVKSSNKTEVEAVKAIIKKALFTNYICKFKVKMDTFNNETRKKFEIVEIHQINQVEYGKSLINEIKEYT